MGVFSDNYLLLTFVRVRQSDMFICHIKLFFSLCRLILRQYFGICFFSRSANLSQTFDLRLPHRSLDQRDYCRKKMLMKAVGLPNLPNDCWKHLPPPDKVSVFTLDSITQKTMWCIDVRQQGSIPFRGAINDCH